MENYKTVCMNCIICKKELPYDKPGFSLAKWDFNISESLPIREAFYCDECFESIAGKKIIDTVEIEGN